jgi:hypothetical protein
MSRVNKANMRAWVAALRSGEYAQGRERLAQWNGSSWSYCCLGVACDLAMKDGVQIQVERRNNSLVFDGTALALPERVMDWLGLERSNPWIGVREDGTSIAATHANDSLRWTFEQIADGIESLYKLNEEDDGSA